jgi:cysteine desulfurase
MSLVYLDWAATAIPEADILEQVRDRSVHCYGNPSSPHRLGREAEALLAESRQRLAGILGCDKEEVLFTSGATESNNMVLFSVLKRGQGRGRKVIVSGIEHASLYEPARLLSRLGYTVRFIRPGASGLVDPARIESEMDESTVLVTLMLVNNETGAIQPLGETVRRVKQYCEKSGRKIHLHTDAVQGFGKIPFNPRETGVDSAAISGHKIGAPRGIGALYLRRGSSIDFLYSGGGQEYQRRPGTENVAGAYGFALAAEKYAQALNGNLERARYQVNSLMAALGDIPGACCIPGSRAEAAQEFSPYILCASFPPLPGEVTVRVMEEDGFIIGTGSACSSRKKQRFRTLDQMGIGSDISTSAVRISLGPATRSNDLKHFAAALRSRLAELRRVTG